MPLQVLQDGVDVPCLARHLVARQAGRSLSGTQNAGAVAPTYSTTGKKSVHCVSRFCAEVPLAQVSGDIPAGGDDAPRRSRRI